jgi:3-hydroxy acid dehydrogenase/malonic semialdehyde reductase
MIPMLDPTTLTVFVTGATAGFGEAVCKRFAEAGARVIGTGRRMDRLEKLQKEIGERCHVAALDVTDRRAVEKVVADLPAAFRNVNVAIANAGLALGLDLADEAKLEDWEVMIDTNINGLLYTIKALLPTMVARDEGHIVLLGSVAGDYPYPGGNVYGATKAFVKQFALNLRADLLGRNIRVTNIEPGMAETEFSQVRLKGDVEKAAATYRGLKPMSAEDIAETIFWSCILPRHLNINRMQMMPVMQAFGGFAVKRS